MSSAKIEEKEEVEVKRPRRSCVQSEIKVKDPKHKNSDTESSSEYEKQDNEKDEDFTLNKPRKKHKKVKKLRKKKEKIVKRQAPSFLQVMNAHRNHEIKYVERQFIDYEDEEDDYDEENKGDDHEEDGKEQISEREIVPEPEPVLDQPKKKRIVIRPWNPMWYQIPH